MKHLLITTALLCSALTAQAQVNYVSGRGNSFVATSGIALQLVEDSAKNIYDNLQVPEVDKNNALGTLQKKASAITCEFNSKNEAGSGIYTYSCIVRVGFDGEIQK